MKKHVCFLAIALCCAIPFTAGCRHEHVWTKATCTEPTTCEECGETEGEPLGHTWAEATCTEPKTCSVCGETEGEALGHDWIDATHETPKTCARCGETEGELLLYDTPAGLTDGYEFGEFDTYNSPASENGLGGTMIWFNGTYESVSTLDLPEVQSGLQMYLSLVKDEGGNVWLAELDLNEFAPIENYTDLKNRQLCFLGRYEGYSEVYEAPAVVVEKIFDKTTGNIISPTMFAEGV